MLGSAGKGEEGVTRKKGSRTKERALWVVGKAPAGSIVRNKIKKLR